MSEVSPRAAHLALYFGLSPDHLVQSGNRAFGPACNSRRWARCPPPRKILTGGPDGNIYCSSSVRSCRIALRPEWHKRAVKTPRFPTITPRGAMKPISELKYNSSHSKVGPVTPICCLKNAKIVPKNIGLTGKPGRQSRPKAITNCASRRFDRSECPHPAHQA